MFFAVMPIDDIRGSYLLEQPAVFRLGHVKLVSPSSLVGKHRELATTNLDQVQIAQRLNTPIYMVEAEAGWLVFNAETAEKLAPLTEQEARVLAFNSTRLPVRSISWVSTVEPGSEYRGGELPAWKVELEGDAHANLWLGANSGKVEAVRTTNWRIYDFLWSLHIMNYGDREDFNSWLLRGFALLGLVTIVSGVVLFVLSLVRRK